MIFSSDPKQATKQWFQVVQDCMVSRNDRAMKARRLRMWRYLGASDGSIAIYNKLNNHIIRLATFLFSPGDLRYLLEFDHRVAAPVLTQSEAAARVLTKKVEAAGLDMVFANAVEENELYGSSVVKLGWGNRGLKGHIVFPWSFGVLREDVANLDDQEAMCEINYLTGAEFWRLIRHLPDAAKIFKSAKAYARRKTNTSDADTYFHQVLIASQGQPVDTSGLSLPEPPGGMVDLAADPLVGVIAPRVLEDTFPVYELTVLDDDFGDYITVQLVEPDILIAPQLRRRNLFVEGMHPYVLVQTNHQEGYIWGRSSLVDLMMLQDLLRERLQDVRKLMGMQYDRLMAIIGGSGITAERYAQFRSAGYATFEPGTELKDLTPQMPADAFLEIKTILEMMNDAGGTPAILRGEGEAGVRAGVHAKTLTKTASPVLRDKSIKVERQCAEMGFKCLRLLQNKWPMAVATDDGQEFLLAQLPDEVRVVVDSHSASPLFEEDTLQKSLILEKAGAVDPMTLLDLVHMPMKDLLKERLKQRMAEQAAFIQQHPELLQKGHKK